MSQLMVPLWLSDWTSGGCYCGWLLWVQDSFPWTERNSLSSSYVVQKCSGAYPGSYVSFTEGIPSKGKLPGLESGHSAPSSPDVRNCGTISPFFPMRPWRGAYLIKHRNFFISFSCTVSEECSAEMLKWCCSFLHENTFRILNTLWWRYLKI
jgi:hypothetical protein